jgi:serine phosphatase RsbU (regulator of sigma subunit)
VDDAPLDGQQPGTERPDAEHSVVLIEDDEGDAYLVRELLAEAAPDLRVEWFPALLPALTRLREPCLAVLVDLGLPTVHGVDAVRTLRAASPSTPLVVLTGLDDEASGVLALSAGAQDYLVKGAVGGRALVRALRYAAERRRADDAVLRLREAELLAAENTRLERGLLPIPLLLGAPLRHHSRYRPGRAQATLGGDFYDLVESEPGRVRALIGDVSGHGPDEAALGVSLRIAWRTLVLAGAPEERVLALLQDVLVSERRSEEVFATVATVELLLEAPGEPGQLSTRVAGHPPPLLLPRSESQKRCDATPLPHESGPPLGVVPSRNWPASTTAMPAGAGLLLFTDGLVEGHLPGGSDPGERLGVEGLIGLIGDLTGDPQKPATFAELPEELINAAETLNGEELADDVAVFLVERQDGTRRT